MSMNVQTRRVPLCNENARCCALNLGTGAVTVGTGAAIGTCVAPGPGTGIGAGFAAILFMCTAPIPLNECSTLDKFCCHTTQTTLNSPLLSGNAEQTFNYIATPPSPSQQGMN